MTKQEYEVKLNNYKTSSAPLDVIEKAIDKLNVDYHGVDKMNAAILKDIVASAAEAPKID